MPVVIPTELNHDIINELMRTIAEQLEAISFVDEGTVTQTTNTTARVNNSIVPNPPIGMTLSYTDGAIRKFNQTLNFPQMEPNTESINGLSSVACDSCVSIVAEWWSSRTKPQLVSTADFKAEIENLAKSKSTGHTKRSLCKNCASNNNCPQILQSMSQFKGIMGTKTRYFLIQKKKQ